MPGSTNAVVLPRLILGWVEGMVLEASLPWCTWLMHYPKDFSLETSHFNSEELGAYVRLRDHYFANNGSLPEDEVVLARIARISDEQWPNVRAMLLTLFKIENGVWTHPRLDEALAVSKVSYETKSANGKKGAQARLKGRSSSANAKPKQTDSEPETDSSIEETPYSPPAGDTYSIDFEKFWEAYPSKVGKDAAFRAFKSVIKKGALLDDLLKGIDRYRLSKPEGIEYCNPAKYLREGRWKDEAPSPAKVDPLGPNPRRDWETRLAAYKPNGYWHSDWGPTPQEGGCKAPSGLLAGWKEKYDLEIPDFLDRRT